MLEVNTFHCCELNREQYFILNTKWFQFLLLCFFNFLHITIHLPLLKIKTAIQCHAHHHHDDNHHILRMTSQHQTLCSGLNPGNFIKSIALVRMKQAEGRLHTRLSSMLLNWIFGCASSTKHLKIYFVLPQENNKHSHLTEL